MNKKNQINLEARERFVEKIVKTMNGVKGKTLAILGLSFKPNTDDMREAPSVYIIKKLMLLGAKIKAFDPIAMENAKTIISKLTFGRNVQDTAKDADALVILTEWNEFKQLDLSEIKKLMKGSYLFDGRNIYDPVKVKSLGFIYKGIGRE